MRIDGTSPRGSVARTTSGDVSQAQHVEGVVVGSTNATLKSVIADVVWVTSFIGSWALLLVLWSTWWVVPCTMLFVCHLAGLSEFVHQTVHQNLFARSRRWNRALGRLAAALIGIDFDTYRDFHRDHHRYANTRRDPERQLYTDDAYTRIARGWSRLSAAGKLARVPRVISYALRVLASFGPDRPFVRAVRWAVPVAILSSGIVEGLPLHLLPVKLVVSWYLPLLPLVFIDAAFAQNEHYGTEEISGTGSRGLVPHSVQYTLAWNLRVPAVIEFFLLKRNHHAEHHGSPGIHWTQARDAGAGRSRSLSTHLRALWTRGPRLIGVVFLPDAAQRIR